MSEYPRNFKLVLLGDQEVGKSSISLTYLGREFNENYIKTIGIDFFRKEINLNGQLFYLSIWDTAGDERFREITLSSIRGSKIIVIVFDLTSKASLMSIEKLISSLNASLSGNFILTIVGNKTDLEPSFNRQAQSIAIQHNAGYFQCSGKTGENLNQVFEESLKRALLMTREQRSFETIKIAENNSINENECC
jgi:small GTP-binding protein